MGRVRGAAGLRWRPWFSRQPGGAAVRGRGAGRRDALLVAVLAWVPTGGDPAERRAPSPYLRDMWRDAAWNRLLNAFDAGLGGFPDEVRVEPRVVRGEAGWLGRP
jgi:hypothetical protein